MQVVLKPGETLEVTFAESDGSVEVVFKPINGREAGSIVVRTEWEDDTGRVGEIYKTEFHPNLLKDEVAEVA